MIKFPHQLQHRLEDLMLTPVDIMPTLLGLLGLANAIPQTVEGTNYADALRSGDFSTAAKPATTPYMAPNRRGLRSHRHTLLVDRDGSTTLFDNIDDPYQLNPIPMDAVPGSTRHALLSALGRWLRRMNDPWYHARKHTSLIIYPS